MKIVDNAGKDVSEAVAIKNYFGVRPGDNATGFMKEIKDLTPSAKTELAQGAAKELGYSVVE